MLCFVLYFITRVSQRSVYLLTSSTFHFDVVLISASFSCWYDARRIYTQNDKHTLSLWKLINILDLTAEIWACMCSQETKSLWSVSCVFTDAIEIHSSVNTMLWICFRLNFTSNPWLLLKFENLVKTFLWRVLLSSVSSHPQGHRRLTGFHLLRFIKANICKNITFIFQSVLLYERNISFETFVANVKHSVKLILLFMKGTPSIEHLKADQLIFKHLQFYVERIETYLRTRIKSDLRMDSHPGKHPSNAIATSRSP